MEDLCSDGSDHRFECVSVSFLSCSSAAAKVAPLAAEKRHVACVSPFLSPKGDDSAGVTHRKNASAASVRPAAKKSRSADCEWLGEQI